MVDLKVFDKAQFRSRDDDEVEPLSYENTAQFLNTKGFNPPVGSLNCQHFDRDGDRDDDRDHDSDHHRRDCGVKIKYGSDYAYLYEIYVPSNTTANKTAFGISGAYLVIGKGIVCLKGADSYDAGADGASCAAGGTPTPVYPGTKTGQLKTGRLTPEKNLKVTVDGNGKIHPMMSTEVEGTLLVISEPAYIDFTDVTEMVPVVYESVDGDWQSTLEIVPPEGFVADVPTVDVGATTGQVV